MSGSVECPRCRVRRITFPGGAGELVCPCERRERIGYHRFREVDEEIRLPRAAPAVEEGEATCFYHPKNRAVAVCEDSGVFLCELCHVRRDGVSLSPSAFAARQNRELGKANSRRSADFVMFDNLALGLALLPMLLIWAVVLTAPATLFLVLFTWHKHPCGLLPRSRIRYILAGLIAVGQLVLIGLAINWILTQ